MTDQKKTISGFSKLSKRGKIKWIVDNFFKDPEIVMRELKSYWLDNEEHQKILDEISENTISNYRAFLCDHRDTVCLAIEHKIRSYSIWEMVV